MSDRELAATASRTDEGLKSLTKLMQILESFSTSTRAQTLAEVSSHTGFPKTTTHRLLLSLRQVGLLDQDGERDRYRLGIKLFRLGNVALANMPLNREARPHVDQLARLTGQSVHLAVFDGRHAVVVGRSQNEADPAARILAEAAPAHCTSVGKAMLAFQPDDVIEQFSSSGLTRFTENTITEPARLREELARTRMRGYAIDEGEHQPGVRCVGAPIKDGGGAVFAAISVSGPAWKMPLEEVDRTAKIVMHHAHAISSAIRSAR